MLILFKLFSSIQILSITIIILFIVFSGLLFVTILVFLMFTLFPISILKLSVSMTSPCSPFMSICISYNNPFAFFLFLFLLVQILSLIHSFFITLDNLWIYIFINIYCPWIFFIQRFMFTLLFADLCIFCVILSILWIKINWFTFCIFWSILLFVSFSKLLVFTLILKTVESIITFLSIVVNFFFFPFVLSHLSVFCIFLFLN